MRNVHVAAAKPYDVLIERGLMEDAGEMLKQTLGRTCKAAILTDDTVDQLYGQQVEYALRQSGFDVCRFAIPHGEENKTLSVWATMLEFLASHQLTRSDAIVALGGGMVGDMTGFAAASYLRGIPFMQIPTTLLAMVDSSVGGKTGLNLGAGKNLAGAFYQPVRVLCDPDALWMLKPEQLADGVAEVIKYGVLGDPALFELVSGGHWHDQMLSVIETCVRAKAQLVQADERDTGERQLLNLGHTLGHAIEKCSHYTLSHGHAVAVGMVYAARIAEKMGLCEPGLTAKIIDCLEANHLPVSALYSADELYAVAISDKKRLGNSITFVLPEKIGSCRLVKMELSELLNVIRDAVKE